MITGCWVFLNSEFVNLYFSIPNRKELKSTPRKLCFLIQWGRTKTSWSTIGIVWPWIKMPLEVVNALLLEVIKHRLDNILKQWCEAAALLHMYEKTSEFSYCSRNMYLSSPQSRTHRKVEQVLIAGKKVRLVQQQQISTYYEQIKVLSRPKLFFTLSVPVTPFYKGKNKNSEREENLLMFILHQWVFEWFLHSVLGDLFFLFFHHVFICPVCHSLDVYS